MLRFAIVLSIFFGLAFSASAQIALPTDTTTVVEDKTTLPDPLTPEAVNALVSRLSDAEVRSLLIEQLDAKAQAAPDLAAEDLALFELLTTGAFSHIVTSVQRFPTLIARQSDAFAAFSERAGGPRGIWMFIGLVAVSLAVGALAELLFGRITRKWRKLPPYETVADKGLKTTLWLLAQRFAGEFLGLLVFVIVARETARMIMPPEVLRLSGLVVPYLIGLPRMSHAIARFLLAPNAPDYRIVYTDNKTAFGLVWHQTAFALLIGLSILLPIFNDLHGVPMGETRLGFWLNFLVHAYVPIVVFLHWDGLVLMMRGSDPDVSPIEAWVSRAYPAFVIFVSVALWWTVNTIASAGTREAFRLLNSAPHYKTMLVLVFAPALDTVIRGLVRHLMPPMMGEGPVAEMAYNATRRSYIRIGRVIVFACVLLMIANIWGMSAQSIASAGVGERIASNLLEFMMILSVGYLIYEVVSLWFNRKLAREMTALGGSPGEEEIGGEGGGAGGSRLSTVLPLMLATARVAITVVFALLALGHAGIDTTPLLAGAGIVGLAVGFGAQKLVTDVVSGVFFLIDDAFRTGEYVEVDGTMGTVEKISIRSMQLRHHKGPVHTIPYGEIPKLTNYSRDWVHYETTVHRAL